MHGYDHSVINPATGDFYHRKAGDRIVRIYNQADSTWSDLPPHIISYNSCCVGKAFYPEMNSILYTSVESGTNGSLIRYDLNSGQWMRVGAAASLPMGTLHQFAEYNPVHKVVVFGGNQYEMYKVDSTGTITRLKQTPIRVGIQATVFTVDPVSGDYLVFNMDRQFYKYDVTTDTWTRQSGTVPIYTSRYNGSDVHGVVATPVSTYGVTLFVTCNGSDCRVTLYKGSTTSVTKERMSTAKSFIIEARPNPFRTATRITLPNGSLKNAQCKIFNVRGELIKHYPRISSRYLSFNAENFPSGIYLLKVITGKKVYAKRLLLH